VLRRYDLAGCDSRRVESGGGTASPKVIIGSSPCRYLLRRRRREFSEPDVIAFDQAVIHRLAEHGVPVVPPIATREGKTVVWHDEWAFEVFPFVEELESFDPHSDDELAQSGDMLGRMHAATEGWQPPGRKDWLRETRMASNLPPLREAIERNVHVDNIQIQLARRMLEAAEEVARQLDDAQYAALPETITHGDYTWANLKFRSGRLAGVFDFDWANRQARLYDVARGIIFIAFPRASTFDDSSIWSLVEPFVYNQRRARVFLDAYALHHAFTADERALLPWFLRENWLSCRIRAMRKVSERERLKILTFGMDSIFEQWNAPLDALSRMMQ
jgi:Ser/Thr protein kinase RdoA (MazF antagonist)